MNPRRCTFLVMLVVTAAVVAPVGWSGEATVAIAPPVAAVRPHIDTVHGIERVDNYYWLRNRGDSAVLAYLEAENAYTESMMEHTEKMQELLFAEMKGRIKETDMTVPYRYMDYYYYARTEEGKQYGIFCRKRGTLDAPEEVLLDINLLAEGHDYYNVGAHEISPSQQILAYTFDTAGAETYTLVVLNLENREYFADTVPNVSSLAWAADNRTLFYTVEDETRRPYRLYRHVLGTPPADDELVYEEADEAYYMGLAETRSREYLVMMLGSQVTSETWFLKSDNPSGSFKVMAPREQNVEYMVDHQGDKFYITTNKDAVNFRLMSAPVTDPSPANWTEVLPARDSVKLEGVDCFKDYLVIYERDRGLPAIRIRQVSDGAEHYVQFDESIYSAYPAGNPSYDATLLRYDFQSLLTPSSVYDYNMATRERKLLKQEEVLGRYVRENYVQERAWATAPDGTRIPISLCYHKGVQRDGRNPLYLYAYGAYGYATEPWFSSGRLSLLDRGFVWAIAHVRGGGDLGRPWYEDGKMLRKKNTFTDFIACGEYLVEQGYTSHDRLVINGASAGGLLIGAVVTMRPGLARVAVAEVPFVDVINSMLDESIPLTVTEFEEWGNPKDREYFDYMLSYSPYDNVAATDYPAMLVTAGLNDPRVQYWEPAKWVAKLRATRADDDLLLLKTNMDAGHGGASGRYDFLKEVAFEYAFIFNVLGISVQ